MEREYDVLEECVSERELSEMEVLTIKKKYGINLKRDEDELRMRIENGDLDYQEIYDLKNT